MANKALLVGCTPGSERGKNDVELTKASLKTMGFTEADIQTMVNPTTADMKKAIEDLANAKPGDKCFLHFSGNGCQTPQK
jgi:hypothetical protein